MRIHHYLSHGAVAVTACLVGGLCGFGSASGRRTIAEVQPTISVAAAITKETEVVTPSVLVASRSTASPQTTPAARSRTVPMNADSAVAADETFRLHIPHGWPVVLVRAMEEGSNWIVQDACTPDEESLYICHADFRNHASDFDRQFELAVVVARTAAEANLFPAGTELQELPTELTVKRVIKVAHR